MSDKDGPCDMAGARVDSVPPGDGDDVEMTKFIMALGAERGRERIAREPNQQSNSKRSCSTRRELSTPAREGSTKVLKGIEKNK